MQAPIEHRIIHKLAPQAAFPAKQLAPHRARHRFHPVRERHHPGGPGLHVSELRRRQQRILGRGQRIGPRPGAEGQVPRCRQGKI